MERLGQKMVIMAGAALLFLLGPLTGASISKGAVKKPEIKLTFGCYLPGNWHQGRSIERWCKEVEKRTNGRVKIHYAPDGTIVKAMETLVALRSGAIDLADVSPTYFPKELPITSVLNAYSSTFDITLPNRAANHIFFENKETVPIMEAEYAKHGMKVLAPHACDDFRFITTKPYYRLADYDGAKMRAPGEFTSKTAARIGIVPVAISPAEIYEALAKGLIQGANTAVTLHVAQKAYEVAKYLCLNTGPIMAAPTTISLKTWNKLPSSVKEVMLDLRMESELWERELMKKEYDEGMTFLKNNGVTVIDLPPNEVGLYHEYYRDLIYDKWIPRMEAQGMGKEARLIIDVWYRIANPRLRR